jgi:hypothetical protein
MPNERLSKCGRVPLLSWRAVTENGNSCSHEILTQPDIGRRLSCCLIPISFMMNLFAVLDRANTGNLEIHGLLKT